MQSKKKLFKEKKNGSAFTPGKPDGLKDANLVNDADTEYATFSPRISGKAFNKVKRSVDIMGMTGIQPFTDVINENDFISVIRDGVPKKALDHLLSITGITTGEVSGIIRISDRTLRRYTSKQKLSPVQSEKIIELARLYSRGEEVFGTLGRFREWMDDTVMALGNKTPKAFLDTSLGIEMLMDELGRIEQGIFA